MKAAMHPRIQRALEQATGRRLLRDAIKSALGYLRPANEAATNNDDAPHSDKPATVRLHFRKYRDL